MDIMRTTNLQNGQIKIEFEARSTYGTEIKGSCSIDKDVFEDNTVKQLKGIIEGKLQKEIVKGDGLI